MREIIPNLYTFSNLMVGRVYLIDDGGDLTIIDAGIVPAAKQILAQLAASGRKPSAVKRILITHAHPDHVGGLHELVAATPNAQVIASLEERPVIEGNMTVPMPKPETLPTPFNMVGLPNVRFKPVPVARLVDEGDVIEGVLGGLQVIPTPGHALGQIAFYQPQLKLIILGDTMMRFFGLRLPLIPATMNMTQAKESIRKLCDMDIEIACFGHGEPILQGAGDQIRAFARKLGIL